EAHSRAAHDREVQVAEEHAAAAGLLEPASHEEPLGLSRRRGELDASRAADAPFPGIRQLLLQSIGLLDASTGRGPSGLPALPQPLELTADGVGERLLVGGLASQILVATSEKLAVPPVGLKYPVAIRAIELEDARGDVLEEVTIVAHDQECPRVLRQ